MKKMNKQTFNRLKEFLFSMKEIGLIVLCLTVFYTSQVLLVKKVNTNVDVETTVNIFSEQLQLAPEFNKDTISSNSNYVYTT